MKRSKSLVAVFFSLSIAFPLYASQAPLFPNATKYRNAGAQPATGRSGSASLEVRALSGKLKTDVEITTGQFDGRAPAGNLDKVQIKFFGPKQDVVVTDNYRHDPSRGGYATFSYASGYRGQRLQVQANVSGIDRARTDVVTVDERVKMRPDLTIQSIEAPDRAYVNQNVTIAALVTERNADAGARANCILSVDGIGVDSATGIWVDAGDSVTCEFTHVFTATGVKQVSVDVADVDPADYDEENNRAFAQIEIVDPSVPVTYNITARDRVVAGHTETRKHIVWQANGGGTGYVYDYSFSEDTPTREVGYLAVLKFDRPVSFPVVVQSSGISDGATFLSTTFTLNASSPSGVAGNSGRCGSWSELSRWLTVCTYHSTSTGALHEWTDVQTGMRSGTVTYYSTTTTRYLYDNGQQSVYSLNNSYGYGIGRQPVPTIGNHVDIRVSVTDAQATYDAAASVDLYPIDVTVAPPESCQSWDQTYSTGRSTGYQCTRSSTHTFGREGSRSGIDQ